MKMRRTAMMNWSMIYTDPRTLIEIVIAMTLMNLLTMDALS